MKRLLLAALVASMPATAQNLRMGVGAQITSADPHFHNISPNNAYASMVFDNLLETDSKARLIGSLAESWKPVGEDAWEFTLRRGVRFHNGSDFTAEDVAFTLERIPQVLNSPGSFRTYTQAITGVEIIDSHTLRLRTNGPAPLLPTDLAQVPMLDRETHQGATTEDFNAGRAAIGTGPYRMMAYRSGDRVELQRFEGHWRGRPAWQSVDYRMITNDAGRTAALLAGDIDIIDQVPTSDIERLRRDQRIVMSEIDSMRFIYFALDHMRDGPTPFITDHEGQRVRRARSCRKVALPMCRNWRFHSLIRTRRKSCSRKRAIPMAFA
jgi:peptide/nickel transport system substrate-binding protein